VTKFARARRLDDSVVEEVELERPVRRHPDDGSSTQRIPFKQLRELVVAMVDDDDDWASEWETELKPTTYQPRQRRPPPPPKRAAPRLSTLDELIASLRAAR
jgi:hypothetical protein